MCQAPAAAVRVQTDEAGRPRFPLYARLAAVGTTEAVTVVAWTTLCTLPAVPVGVELITNGGQVDGTAGVATGHEAPVPKDLPWGLVRRALWASGYAGRAAGPSA